MHPKLTAIISLALVLLLAGTAQATSLTRHAHSALATCSSVQPIHVINQAGLPVGALRRDENAVEIQSRRVARVYHTPCARFTSTGWVLTIERNISAHCAVGDAGCHNAPSVATPAGVTYGPPTIWVSLRDGEQDTFSHETIESLVDPSGTIRRLEIADAREYDGGYLIDGIRVADWVGYHGQREGDSSSNTSGGNGRQVHHRRRCAHGRITHRHVLGPRQRHRRCHRRHHAHPVPAIIPPFPSVTPPPSASHVTPPIQAADNETLCVTQDQDPTAWLASEHASVMRVIVNPGMFGASGIPQPVAGNCIADAVRAGIRVYLSLGYPAQWRPDDVAEFTGKVLRLYGDDAWAVGVGNEEDLSQDGAATPEQYVAQFAAGARVVARLAPQAIRVAADSSPGAIAWTLKVMVGAKAAGADVVSFHCYDENWHNGLDSAPKIAAAAASAGLQMWCGEMADGLKPISNWLLADTPVQWAAKLADVEARSPNLRLICDFYWPGL